LKGGDTMSNDKKLEKWVSQLTQSKKEDKTMKEKTIDKKQAELQKKVKQAKEKVVKRGTEAVKELNRAPLKTVHEKPKEDKKEAEKPAKEPETTWLEKYISNPEGSGAKKVTALFARDEGCSVDEAVRVATEYGQKKGSKWGQTKGSIKSHLSFLKGKGCDVKEIREGVYKVSQ